MVKLNTNNTYYVVNLNTNNTYYVVKLNTNKTYYVVKLNTNNTYYVVKLNTNNTYYVVKLNTNNTYYVVKLNTNNTYYVVKLNTCGGDPCPSEEEHVSCFHFPSNEEIMKIWESKVPREGFKATKYSVLYEKHFTSNDFQIESIGISNKW